MTNQEAHNRKIDFPFRGNKILLMYFSLSFISKKGPLLYIPISTVFFVCFLYILLLPGINDITVEAWASPSSLSDNDKVDGGLNSTNNTAENFQTYVNPTFGFKIDYPSNWSYQQYDPPSNETIYQLVNIVPPLSEDPNFVTSLEIGIDELQDLTSLDIYARESVSAYRTTYQNFSLISVNVGDNSSNTNFTLSGKPSYQIVFTDSLDGISRKNIEVGTLDENNNRIYYLLFKMENSRYDKLLPFVQRIIESFALGNLTSQKLPSNDIQVENNNTNSEQSFLVYSNPQLGIRLDYPAYAEVQERMGYFDQVFFNTSVGYNFSMGVYPTGYERIDNQYVQTELKALRETYDMDFELLNSENTTLSGYPAHSLKFRYTDDNGISITNKHIYTVVDESAYFFQVTSITETYEVDLPIFERIADSVEITGKPENYDADMTFEEYTNPFGFSISYPADSLVEEDQNIVRFTIPDKGMSIVSIGAHRNINTPLDQLLEEQINNYKNNMVTQNFELIKSENRGSAEDPSGSIEYELTLDGERIFGKDIIAIVDNTAYSFIFQTESVDIKSATPIMNNMLDSFRIIQPSVADNQVPSESGFDNSSNNSGEPAGFGQQRNEEGLDPEQTISNLDFLTYRHPTHGFTIEYPNAPGLEVDELNYGVIFQLSKNSYAVLLANIDGSLGKYVSDVLEFQERDYIDYKLIDQTDTTVNGHDAIQIEYTRTNDKGIPIHTLECYVLSDKILYDLVFTTAYPTASTLNDFRVVVQKMIDSFEFPQSGSSITDDNQQRENVPGSGGFGSSDDSAAGNGGGNDGESAGFGQRGNDEGGFDPFG